MANPFNRPDIIYWKLRSGIVLTSIFNRELCEVAEKYDVHTRTANHVVLRHWIPYGVVSWRTDLSGEWQPLPLLPEQWGLQ